MQRYAYYGFVSQDSCSATLDGQTLSTVDHLTILGVDISSDLSWSRHAHITVRGKLSGRLAVLRRFGGSLNTNTRRQIFNGFVKSHLLYCLPVWGNTPLTCQRHFDKLLTTAARFILNKHDVSLNRTVYDSTALCEFNLHVMLASVLVVFNYLHTGAPDKYSDFNLLRNSQSRCSRATAANKLDNTVFKRACDNMCFLSTAASHWNNLPNNVTASTAFKPFLTNARLFVKTCMQ
jgi:hypothetical protein